MPITVTWTDEKQSAILLSFQQPWTWDDYYSAYHQGYQMADSVAHPYAVVLDFNASGGALPPNALTHFKRAAANPHPRRAMIIIVSGRMYLARMLVNVVQKIVPMKQNIHMVEDMEKALALVERESVNWKV